MVAFEVARMLRQAGHQVELLSLLDVPLVNARLRTRMINHVLARALRLVSRNRKTREHLMAECMAGIWLLSTKVNRYRKMNPTLRREKWALNFRRYIASSGQRMSGHLPNEGQINRDDTPLSSSSRLQEKMSARMDHYLRVLATYLPAPVDFPIVFFSSEHNGRFLKRISSNFEIINVPGDHYSCITTHMHMVADHLRSRLHGPSSTPSTSPVVVLPARIGTMIAAPTFDAATG
jgi:thioesterase domain-containing protein